MTAFFYLLLFFLLSLAVPGSASAQDRYYPMEQYGKRITLKDFGVLIDDQFYKQVCKLCFQTKFSSFAYKGKESLFPFNRFYGYHAGVDLEVLPKESEQKVPVYAVKKGRITYIGLLEGYGGVILQSLEGENLTALYGHVKTTNLPYKVGGEILSGMVVTYLGDEFSSETSKERKHLHFAIYKGTDLYFRGHESSLEQLNNRWINPTTYLKNKGAIDPKPTAFPISTTVPSKTNMGLLYNLIEVIKTLFQHFGFKL